MIENLEVHCALMICSIAVTQMGDVTEERLAREKFKVEIATHFLTLVPKVSHDAM